MTSSEPTRDHLDSLLGAGPAGPPVGGPGELLVPDPAVSRAELGAAQRYLAAPIAGGVSGPGMDGFLVDPDLARVSLGRLDEVITGLNFAMEELRRRAYFPPPGQDQVSLQLAQNGRTLVDRAISFTIAWRDRIQAARDALAAQIAAYERADRDAIL